MFAQDGSQEKKFSFLFTNDFTYQKSRLAKDPDQFHNSSSFFLKYGNWAGGLTFRGYNYYKQSTSYTLEDPEFDLYRKYVQYTTPELDLLAGDFHSMLGRGMVLSVLQNEKAYRERTILGGDFNYHSDHWQIRTLGGSVEDEMKYQKWRVAGGGISRDYWKGNRLGFNASFIHDEKTFQKMADRLTWSVTANADKLPWGLSYYAEISRLNLDNDRYRPDGSGYYTNVGWTRKNVTLMFEYKKYKDFDNGLNNPPSADRGDEAIDLIDSETVRLYTQYSFFTPDIIAFVSIGRARELDAFGPQIYTGVNASDIAERLDLSFGYSFKETFYPITIIDGQATFRITGSVAVGLAGRDKRYRDGSYRFNERDWMPQVSWAPYGAVFFQRQYSRALIDGHHYFNSYGFRFNVRRDSYIEFSTGSVRGGEVCASGQCYFVPPFKGWKTSLFVTVR